MSVTCAICGAVMSQLYTHINKKHNMTTDEYRIKYKGHPLVSSEIYEKQTQSSNSPYSLKFYLKKGKTLAEAKQSLREFLDKRNEDLSWNHFTKEYRINRKGMTDEEAELDLSNSNIRTTLSSFIGRYGEEEGLSRYNSFTDKIKYRQSVDYFKDNYGENWESKYQEFLKSKDNTSLDSFIKRYGEKEGAERYKLHCEKVGVTLDKMISLYGKEKGENAYYLWVEACNHNLDYFITKFGEKEGSERYLRWREQATMMRTSEPALALFKKLDSLLPDDKSNKTIYYPKSKYEFSTIVNKKAIFVDFNLGNLIIEFNGDFWHANPKFYTNPDEMHPTGLLVKELHEKDQNRVEGLQSLGFKVLVVWEFDYKNNEEEVINTCLNFIKDNYEG